MPKNIGFISDISQWNYPFPFRENGIGMSGVQGAIAALMLFFRITVTACCAHGFTP
jgi:hypothetical protein